MARQYDAVCVESLHFREMTASQPALKPKACDNACAQFYRRLEQAFRTQGKRFVRIGRYFPSSQLCSVCGKQAGKLPAGERRFRCPHCGTIMQRDLNAARNIRDEGIRLLGL